MKKIILLFFLLVLFYNCVSVKKYNKRLEEPIAVDKLKEDVDFIYQKLQRLQPDLYWYITKQDLNFKFDSIKNTIYEPLTSTQFYYKISPLIAFIRQGHVEVGYLGKKLSVKEQSTLKKKELVPYHSLILNYLMINFIS